MNESRFELLEKEDISKALLKLSIPMVMGMMIQVFYNLVDTYFIGKLGDANQLAAANIAFPVFVLLMAIANIIGTGAASYISRCLGKKQYDEVSKTTSVSFLLLIVISLIVTILGILLCSNITKALGATGEVYDYTYSYINIMFIGAITVIGSFTLGQLLRAEGNMKSFVRGMVIGTVLNIVLDPVFIFGFKMGIKGAAFATIIGYLVSLIYYIKFFLSSETILKLDKNYFKFDKDILSEIFKIGIPSSLNQMLMGFANVVSNNIAVNYGTLTVAGMGVAMKVMMIGTFIFIGFSSGSQPLIGYNYGAGNINRVKEAIKKGIKITMSIGIVLSVVFYLFSENIIGTFIDDTDVIKQGSIILKALLISLPFIGPQMIGTVTAQSLGKALLSTILSVSRQGILYIPLILILNNLFGFDGFIYAQPITDIIMMMLSLFLITNMLKKEQ